jgi:hypothetical protein
LHTSIRPTGDLSHSIKLLNFKNCVALHAERKYRQKSGHESHAKNVCELFWFHALDEETVFDRGMQFDTQIVNATEPT